MSHPFRIAIVSGRPGWQFHRGLLASTLAIALVCGRAGAQSCEQALSAFLPRRSPFEMVDSLMPTRTSVRVGTERSIVAWHEERKDGVLSSAVDVGTMVPRVSAVRLDSAWGVEATLSRREWWVRRETGRKYVDVVNNLHTAGATLWRSVGIVTLGAHFGESWLPRGTGDSCLQVHQVSGGPGLIDYGAHLGLRLGPLTARGSYASTVIAAGVGRFRDQETGHFRTFPLAVRSRGPHIDLSARSGGLTVGADYAMQYLGDQQSLASRNMMPGMVEYVSRRAGVRFEHDGERRTVRADVCGGLGAGYVAGTSYGEPYFEVDTILYRSAGVSVRFARTGAMSLKLFGEYRDGGSPFGRIDMTPFSSWSLFREVHVQLREMAVREWEAGLSGTVGRHHGINRPSLELGLSAVSARIEGRYRLIERYIFIPVVTEDAKRKKVNFTHPIALVHPSYRIPAGPLELSAGVAQYLPLGATGSNKVRFPQVAGGGGTPITSNQLPRTESKTWGGLFLTLDATLAW